MAEPKGWDWLDAQKRGESEYSGVREAIEEEFALLSEATKAQIETILRAMELSELVSFEYDGLDRVVAPFVIGLSSEGNPLVRGYQTEGVSKSGRGPGWRVFQVEKMGEVTRYFEYFDIEQFEFDHDYPWIYKVFRTL